MMEREELVRQVAELEAAMGRMTFAPPVYMMQALASLKSRLAAIDAAASVAVSTTIDEAEDAIDVPSDLTREEIKRRIAELEAALLPAPPLAKVVIMTALVALRAQLAALDAAARKGAEDAVDEADEATEEAMRLAIDAYLTEKEWAKDLSYAAAEDFIKGAAREEGWPEELIRAVWFEKWGNVGIDTTMTVKDVLYPAMQFLLGDPAKDIQNMLAGAMKSGAGMPFLEGLPIGENMAAAAPEVVKRGSPAVRKGYEVAERAVANELDTHAKKLIDELKKSHSPITPDESTIVAGTMGAGSITGFVGLAAAGSAIEGATLGQMEIPGHFLLQLGGMYGLAKMAGSVVSVPYRWAVDVGHNYKWASVFQPMIPPYTDLVRMEVREVFRDEFRKEQLEEPTSKDFKKWIAYHGYSEYHADSIWAAHWDLPSITQSYEMFARLRPGRVDKALEFSRDDLLSLLRRQDVLKRYREQLIAIAYQVPTRREIRMMVNAGTIDRDEAEQMYLDRRVAPQFAGMLADFAWARAQRDPYRERFISACIRHAKEGYFTRERFKETLQGRKVPSALIEDAWGLAELDYEYDYKTDLLKEIREKLHKKKITMDDFIIELARIVPVPERARTIVERERAKIKLEAS